MKTPVTRLRVALTGKQGFALVITLSLLILLTVIAVGLLSLSSISLRASSQTDAMNTARANARLGIMMALGELQKQMGPDQRISAPGSLDNTPAATHRQNWTAVYDSWVPPGTNPQTISPATPDDTRPAQPRFRRWLVSGDESYTSTPGAPPAQADTAVILVPRTASEEAVTVTRMPTKKANGQVSGSFAWWVSDQSTKARIAKKTPGTTTDQWLAEMQAAPRTAHEVVLNNPMLPSDNQLDRLATTGTLGLVYNDASGNPAPQQARNLIHHANSFSNGLVTNVRRGGFRKDLSFALEQELADFVPMANGYPSSAAGYLYRVPGFAPEPEGISLAELWQYANMRWQLGTSSGIAGSSGKQIPSGAPLLTNQNGPNQIYSDPFAPYRCPSVVQFSMLLSLKSQFVTPTSYRLNLIVDPIMTIWNPYNVSVRLTPAAFVTYASSLLPYTLEVSTASATHSFTMAEIHRQQSSANMGLDHSLMFARVGRNTDIIMRPGEVQIIGQGFSGGVQNIGLNNRGVDCEIGWNPTASGVKWELKKVPGSNTDLLFAPNDRITYRLTPNSGRVASSSRVYSLDTNVGYTNGDNGNWTTTNSPFGRIRLGTNTGETADSTNGKKIFPVIASTTGQTTAVSNMVSLKKTMAMFSVSTRTEADSTLFPSPAQRYDGRQFARWNPKVTEQRLASFDTTGQALQGFPAQVVVRPVADLTQTGIDITAQGLGFYGASLSQSGGGVNHIVTTSLPVSPMISLGAFQHAVANGRAVPLTSSSVAVKHVYPSASFSLGNSLAQSVLPPGQVSGTMGGLNSADHSYLGNMGLWDDYFFSSISPTRPDTLSVRQDEQKEMARSLFENDIPLPNPRMVSAVANDPTFFTRLITGNSPSQIAEKIASGLFIDGVFNVNSTSVTAWKAVLGSLKAASIPIKPALNPSANSQTTTASNYAVSALLQPAGSEISEADLNDVRAGNQWLGYRSLSDAQLDELAKAIVDQVRLRGPFISMADFVNRRPGPDKTLAVSGAIQAALDNPKVSINSSFSTGSRSLPLAQAQAQSFAFPEAEVGAKSFGSPGYVKQGDILTPLAPMISVRGDTFLIRAYGDSVDSSGKPVARVWAEAIVQREPSYVDPVTDVPTANPPVSPVNQKMGRRFSIISFRYLPSAEVNS